MKTLLVMRHGKSSWKHPELADHDRPLNKRGKQDAPRIGDLLRVEDLIPDLIISSTAVRARATAAAVAEASGYSGQIKLTRALYAAAPEAYLEVLRGLPDEYGRVMVVGHNPGLAELVEMLTGEAEEMPSGALARLTLPVQKWRALNETTEGELIGVWRPRELA